MDDIYTFINIFFGTYYYCTHIIIHHHAHHSFHVLNVNILKKNVNITYEIINIIYMCGVYINKCVKIFFILLLVKKRNSL